MKEECSPLSGIASAEQCGIWAEPLYPVALLLLTSVLVGTFISGSGLNQLKRKKTGNVSSEMNLSLPLVLLGFFIYIVSLIMPAVKIPTESFVLSGGHIIMYFITNFMVSVFLPPLAIFQGPNFGFLIPLSANLFLFCNLMLAFGKARFTPKVILGLFTILAASTIYGAEGLTLYNGAYAWFWALVISTLGIVLAAGKDKPRQVIVKKKK